jgi:hypothetical protein
MTLKTIGYAALLIVASATLAIGSATPGEAKAKKKAAAPAICTWDWKPVCGEKAGIKITYSNACQAKADGAKIVSKGECTWSWGPAPAPEKKAHKKKAKKKAPAKADKKAPAKADKKAPAKSDKKAPDKK